MVVIEEVWRRSRVRAFRFPESASEGFSFSRSSLGVRAEPRRMPDQAMNMEKSMNANDFSTFETGQMSAVETVQMSAAEAGQISAAETGQMSAAETGQMSAVPESSGSAKCVRCSQEAPAGV